MEKAKNEKIQYKTPKPNPVLGCLAILILGIIASWTFFIFGLPLITGFRVWESLETTAPELVPTAEALLQNPQENSEFALDLSHVNEGYPLCVDFTFDTSATYNLDALQDSSLLYIDGVEVQRGVYSALAVSESSELSWCAYGRIASGLHLVEFHLKDGSSAEALAIQQWGIMIP